MNNSNRRNFIKSSLAISPLFALPIAGFSYQNSYPEPEKVYPESNNLKLSLNAYSFNRLLMDGTMSLEELLEFCSQQGFQAVDITAYYFPGYPETPSDEFLFDIKRKAFALGLDISGTGVRNDFTHPDKAKRKQDVQMVKNWILAASKIGAPVIRIFSGTQNPENYSWDQIAAWMLEDIKECVQYGKEHGIVVALQNHNDFVKTADQVIYIMDNIGSEWFGLILDIGSFAEEDPYKGIEKNISYAVSWQIKENINRYGEEEKVDLDRLMSLIKNSNYHGYLPIETLGPGDPFVKVPAFLEKVRKAMKAHKLM